MKPTAAYLFLTLSLLIILNVESFTGEIIFQVDCSRYKKLPLDESPACTREWMPICGSDGKTYANKCIFCHAVKQSDDNIKFVRLGYC